MSSAEDLEADEEGGEASDNFCASCGIAEVDDIKLKKCDGCDLVRYCSDDCQQLHRPEHEVKCKERATEIRDEILFRQPESTHLGDCPICCVPLPIDLQKSTLYSCCSKLICKGCAFANHIRQERENVQRTCPFCRYPLPKTEEEGDRNRMNRVEANDPAAIREMGIMHFEREEYDVASKYYRRAAELGDDDAHHNLSILYSEGQGVEKDEKKKIFHLEEAAIAGHPDARHNLGCHEWNNNKNGQRAVKHFIIAANLGNDRSIKALKQCYKDGYVSKEDFAAALRGHKAAVDATKSPQRTEAAKILSWTP